MASDLKRLRRLARKHGWTVIPTRNSHLVFIGPDGTRIYCESTASDYRSLRNTIARLRRAGLPVPHRGKPHRERDTR